MRVFLAIALAIAALGASAQKATVDRVELTNNIAASKYPKYDLNGRTAALVIVQLIDDNVEFKGSVLEVVKQTGEYWVYMGVGAKELHIHSSKFLPVEIRFPEYGIPRLESAATYAVTVQLPATAAAPAQSAASGRNYAVFTVNPSTATVTIDGTTHEPRSGKVRVLLRQGTYDYSVDAPGYLPDHGNITIGTDKTELTVTLRSNKGTLAVSSATRGTEIYVNGEKVGTNFWQGELPPGEYLVEGKLASHRSVEQLAKLETAGQCSVALPALSAITGSLNVDFEPDNAVITIDGTVRGTAPVMLDGILAGTHSVTISAPGHTPQTHNVSIADSQISTLSGTLSKITFIPFSLCAEAPDGKIVYFNTEKWKSLSSTEQHCYKKKGVVLNGNGETFLIELEDEEEGKQMQWVEALKYNLPTKEQAKIIAGNNDALNNALEIFGGSCIFGAHWTKTEDDSSYAWSINMHRGTINSNNKSNTYWVRAIAPLPTEN